VAKNNQSFCNVETEIDLQELNGIDMGRILHSTNVCINIVNHIGSLDVSQPYGPSWSVTGIALPFFL
jgi:hypothetical protein